MDGKKNTQRLAHIDCMRGLACIIMFQRHCYDSWSSEAARAGAWFRWSTLVSTLAAPAFLFLVGFSLSLAVESMYRRGATGGVIAASTLRRGWKLVLLALLFRFQEYLLGLPGAPWTDLLRVDILNVIGVSIILMALICWPRQRSRRGIAAAVTAVGIVMAAPLLWTGWRPRWLPWPLESYINGVHTFGRPQPWLFPIFPWAAFCFAGLAVGSLLGSEWMKRREGLTMICVAAAGALLAALALGLDALPFQLYHTYDFWHTSPNFFLSRLGILLGMVAACYWWSRYGARQWGFARLIQLGQSSLLVYWVHIEFVYGRFSILPKRGVGIPEATVGLITIIAAMMLLASWRPWLLAQRAKALARFRQKPEPVITLR